MPKYNTKHYLHPHTSSEYSNSTFIFITFITHNYGNNEPARNSKTLSSIRGLKKPIPVPDHLWEKWSQNHSDHLWENGIKTILFHTPPPPASLALSLLAIEAACEPSNPNLNWDVLSTRTTFLLSLFHGFMTRCEK